ncbi:MAG: HlyC/CorC family transporter [Flavobacteriaceae bacterium]|nr:HlyC/CorC family transporter [Flavobacteriaceae bacterium]
MGIDIIIIVTSILLSAFFSGMEIAYVSANKFQVELEKKEKNFQSRILEKLTSKSSKFITTMLVGNNISLVVYGFFMGDLLTKLFPLEGFSQFSILLVQTIISTLVILITAEFLPKAIFQIYANEALRFFAVPAYFFYVIFHYISNFITAISNFFLKVFFNTSDDEEKNEFGKEELGQYIEQELENVDNDTEVDSEIQIFQNALEFHNVKAREIMIPRTEIEAVEIGDSIEEVQKLFVETGYSKILVYKESLDEIKGYIHISELFKKPKNIRSILLPVEFVPESMMISDVLNILIKKKRSLSVVLDEFGGTSGLITIEDIVEEIFGEIIDEYDTVELLENKISDSEYEFSARLEVDVLNEKYDLKFEENEAYETLSGYIVYHHEDIPKENEVIQIKNYRFTMLKVESSRIMEVRLDILDSE